MSGFDARVEYKKAVFLVQTQDKGPAAQYVESLIYKSGTLLTSRKTFYTSFLDSPNLGKIISQIMADQHRSVADEIKQGKFERFLSEGEKR